MRLILSGFAYTLFERLRTYLKKTSFARMSPSNLRLKLIKVGAVIIRNTCRIRVLMSESYPYKTALSNLVRRVIPNLLHWRPPARHHGGRGAGCRNDGK